MIISNGVYVDATKYFKSVLEIAAANNGTSGSTTDQLLLSIDNTVASLIDDLIGDELASVSVPLTLTDAVLNNVDVSQQLKALMANSFNTNLLNDFTNSTLYGNPTMGNDIIVAPSGHYTVQGLFGNDLLVGGNGVQDIYGELQLLDIPGLPSGTPENPVILTFGNDTIFAGNGKELAVGDLGTLNLHPEIPVAYISGILGNDTIFGGNGIEVLVGDKVLDNTQVTHDFISIVQICGNDIIFAGNGNQLLAGDCEQHIVNVQGPASGTPLIFTSSHTCGDDQLFAGVGNNIMVGDEVNLQFQFGGVVTVNFTSPLGDDVLVGGKGNNTMIGDNGTISMVIDPLAQINFETFKIIGGDNVLISGQGNDTMWGGSVTASGLPEGTLVAGHNTFVFDLTQTLGHDQVMDFDHTNDSLTFELASGSTLADLESHVTFFGDDGTGHVEVRFDNGAIIDFKNVALTTQDSIADLVDNAATQIHIIHP